MNNKNNYSNKNEEKSYLTNENNKYKINKEKDNLILQRKKIEKYLFILWIFICIISITLFIRDSKSKIEKDLMPSNIILDNDTDILQIPENLINPYHNDKIKKYMSNSNEKVGLAFVFESMCGNGIGRMLSVLFEELS